MSTDKGIVLACLKEARLLLSEPKRWTQGVYAQRFDGRKVRSVLDERILRSECSCFCILGAVHAVSQPEYVVDVVRALRLDEELVEKYGTIFGIASFNDDPQTKHADVMGLLTRTIRRLEE